MLKKLLFFITLLLSLSAFADNPKVLLDTSLGEIELELDEQHAPASVANFLAYVDSGFYDGTQFHRVIPGFMVQGGGFDQNMQQKNTEKTVNNESQNGLPNVRGSLAYARHPHPDSASSQFFINLVDNHYLNYRPGRPGYTVFGKVTRGMDVVDKIARVATGVRADMPDVPLQPIFIRSAKRL